MIIEKIKALSNVSREDRGVGGILAVGSGVDQSDTAGWSEGGVNSPGGRWLRLPLLHYVIGSPDRDVTWATEGPLLLADTA